MRSLTVISCVALFLFSLSEAQAKIIHVPGDSSTIQGGINGAVNGDTVLVAPGTYYEHINFNGKAILVTSEAEPESTAISKLVGGLALVTFNSGEDTNSIIDGFTIRNATISGLDNGAILCDSSSPTIRNNILTQNAVDVVVCFQGSGAYCSNNVIKDNAGAFGIGCWGEDQTNVTVSRNLIFGNWFGIVTYGNDDIINNTISNNAVNLNPCWTAIIKNNIVVNGLEGIRNQSAGLAVVSYNDVWGNIENYTGGVTSPGEGDISADPMFCDPDSDNYYLDGASPCLGAGEGGVNIGAFGPGCNTVFLSPGPDQADRATTDVPVKFYIENLEGVTDSFHVSVADSLGWNINPLYHEVILESDELDSVFFTVSIPNVPVGTTDRIFATAISQSDSSFWDSASLTVACNAYVEDWEIVSGNDILAPSNTQVTAVFYIHNAGLAPDSCYLTMSDSLEWDIQPQDYQLTLNPGQQDSVFFDIQIPSVPVGTTDKITLIGVSLTNPFVADTASLFVICESYNVTITEISDVGNDQGKQVHIDWTSFPGSDPLVTDFSVFRRRDSLLIIDFAKPTADQSSPVTYPPGEWQWLATIPAFGETLYSAVVPTLKDSTIAEGMYWSVFFIRAGTDTPTVYFDSPVDSGYSLDNLSPSPPTGLFASHETAVTKLTWSMIPASDFDYSTVYRDTLSGFTPDPSNTLGFTIDTTLVDSTAQLGRAYYYIVSATDFSGNESDPSNQATGIRYIAGDCNADGGIDLGDVLSLITYLYRNGPSPSPIQSGDGNCDGVINLGDILYLTIYLYRGGPAPCEP